MTRDRRQVRTDGRAGVRRCATLALAVLSSVAATGCTDFAGYDLDVAWGKISALATMRTSVSYDPYEIPRLPAPNTVPVAGPAGELAAPFTQAQLDSVGAALRHPGAADETSLALGRQVYDVQCATCHGADGGGNGPVVGPGKFPFAPAVNNAATAARSDGYLYGVIRVGRGLMPPYGAKVPDHERWAVVDYLRYLQQQGGASAAAPAPAAATAPQAPAGPTPADSARD